MAGGVHHLDLTTAEVDDLAVLEKVDLAFVVAEHTPVVRMYPNFGEAADASDMVAVAVCQGHDHGLVGKRGDSLVKVGHAGTGVNHEGLVSALQDVYGFVIDEVAVALPCTVVDLAEHDIFVAVDEFFGIMVTVCLGPCGAPGDDGAAVAEIGVQAALRKA